MNKITAMTLRLILPVLSGLTLAMYKGAKAISDAMFMAYEWVQLRRIAANERLISILENERDAVR